MPTEREEAVVLFIRASGESPIDENEEYARVYLELRGPDRWLNIGAPPRLASIRRGFYPFYLVPIPSRNGYWVIDATSPVNISTFDEFKPSTLTAQLNYLVNKKRTDLEFTGEVDQAIFDHIYGALTSYSRLQDDYNGDLSAVISKEFLVKRYVDLIAASKPLVLGALFRTSPYEVTRSEKMLPAFSWEEASKVADSIEKRIESLTAYFDKCNGSTGELESRIVEFGDHAKTAETLLSKELEDYKALKSQEEKGVNEKAESDLLDVEKSYKPLLAKAEKQLKVARDANEAAQIELMPVQQVYNEMTEAAAKIQDSVNQSTAAREEATQKAAEFRMKYTKLQEDQSNIQARSKSTDDKAVPEDTPLDAEMAYLERQALSYESKVQQLDEELKRLAGDQERGQAELEKFGKSYRPIKAKADEAKDAFEQRGAELEGLKRQKENETETIQKKRQSEVERITSEVAHAEGTLKDRFSHIDKSCEDVKSSAEKLKATLTSAKKYADEVILPGLEQITLMPEIVPRIMHYPFYTGGNSGAPGPAFSVGRTVSAQVAAQPSGTPTVGYTSTQTALDSYIQGRLPSFQWGTAPEDFDLFNDIQFKGRLIMGFKGMAAKGAMAESRMLKLAREVAVANLKLS